MTPQPPRYPYPPPAWQPAPPKKTPIPLIIVLGLFGGGYILLTTLAGMAPNTPPPHIVGHITDVQAAQVRIGMGSADVAAILGRPDVAMQSGRYPNWIYMTTTGGRLTIGYYEGRVQAAALDDANHREVFAIAAPDAGIEVR